MRVFIYWNFRRQCWSIKALAGPDKGRVKYHASAFIVSDAVFKVSEVGRQRVILRKRKNVHAGIVGNLESWRDLDGDDGTSIPYGAMFKSPAVLEVSYNPYRGPTFVSKYVQGDNTSYLACRSAVLVNACGRVVLAYMPRAN